MKIEVNMNLFAALIECIDKQAKLGSQPEATQEKWKAIINETYITANNELQLFLTKHGHGDSRRTETGLGPLLSPEKSSFV